MPLISALPGFVEYYWIDLRDGAMISITIFKTLSEAIDANEKARIWVQDLLSSVLGPSVRIEAGSIVAYKGKEDGYLWSTRIRHERIKKSASDN